MTLSFNIIVKYILILSLVLLIGCSKKEDKIDVLSFYNNEICKNENILNEALFFMAVTHFDNFDPKEFSDLPSKDRQEKIKNEYLKRKASVEKLCNFSKYLNDINQAMNNTEINLDQYKNELKKSESILELEKSIKADPLSKDTIHKMIEFENQVKEFENKKNVKK